LLIDANTHIFRTGTTERLRIDSSGNVGIGTSSPSTPLHLSQGAANTFFTLEAYAATQGATAGINVAREQLSGSESILSFWTNTGSALTERMRIDSSGNVGIGISNPTQKLTLQNGTFQITGASTFSGNVEIGRVGGNNNMGFATGGSERMRITSGGFLKASNTGSYISSTGLNHEFSTNQGGNYGLNVINTHPSAPFGFQVFYPNTINDTSNRFIDCEDNSALRLSVRSNGGLANYQTNDVNLSDERVKTDISPLGSYWDKIKAIEIVNFKYKDQTHDDDNIGLIAQQVESVAPELVSNEGFGETPEGEEPLKSIYTTDLYHAAIKVLQEAMTKIETLEARIETLENK
jgi:hypothetical protein